jgi:hypothetical protein
VAERKWQFKTKFRAKAFGWRGSRLAISRLKEAFSEIKAAAKFDPVVAGDGAVSLMERVWPAFQDIDISSGGLGAAVARTLDELTSREIFQQAIRAALVAQRCRHGSSLAGNLHKRAPRKIATSANLCESEL